MKTSLAAWCTVLLLSAACVPYAAGQVRVHYPDRAYSTLSYGGSQWIASPRGLYRYRFDDKVWSAYGPQNGLLSTEVSSLDVRNDVLWIGQRGGITSFDLRSNTMLHFDSTQGFSAGAVRAAAFEEDYVWTGGSRGAARYDNLIEEWQRVTEGEGLTGTAVHAIVPMDDRVFLATSAAINEYDPRYERWRSYTPPGDDVVLDAFTAGGWIWLLRERDLLRFDPEARVFSLYPLDGFTGADIREIAVIGGNFWIITGKDLWLYESGTDALRPFLELEQVPERETLDAVALSTDGSIVWFSTAAGLTRFDRSTSEWLYYTTASGLPDVPIRALFALGDGVVAFSDDALVYYRTDQERWYSFPLLEGDAASGARYSLDPAEGSFIDFGKDIRLDLSGTRTAWLFENPFGNEDLFMQDEISSRNDLKARLDFGNGRRISALYNDSDFEDVTYGVEYRGARDDVLQSLQWGDMRIDQGNHLLEQSFGVFGIGGRAVYGDRSERYGRSFFEVTGVSGHKTTATATDAFYGRTRFSEESIPDFAWQKNTWYHLRTDRQHLPLAADAVTIYLQLSPPKDHPSWIADAEIAGIRGDWLQLIEGRDFFVDPDNSLIRFHVQEDRPVYAAVIRRGETQEELLLGNAYEQPLMIHNRYFVGGTEIIPSTFHLSITDVLGGAVPLSQFGLDRNGDGQVDHEFMDYRAGILHFPEDRPFPPAAYDSTSQHTYTMKTYFEAFSVGYRLRQRRIIRGSERVLVDGLQMTAGEDYILDYSSGFLLFTRDGAVQDDSRIEVQYEYVRPRTSERFTRVGVTVSPSDFAQGSASGGQFHRIGDDDPVQFAQARAEVRWQSEALDLRVQPEYKATWSDSTNGQAAGLTATLSTPQARISLQSTLRDHGFAEPVTSTFAHGRLLDEHRVDAEYDLLPSLRAFAVWTKRSGYDRLQENSTKDMFTYGGMQWVGQGLPSFTLRGERFEETMAHMSRDRTGGRLDVYWIPNTTLLESVGFSTVRISGYTRFSEEDVSGGLFPGQYRNRNYFLRTVFAPRPLFTVNAYFQSDQRMQKLGGSYTDDRSNDKLYLDVIMEQLRGISFAARITRDIQEFATTGSAYNSYLRAYSQGSLRLSPGTWISTLTPITLYLTASRSTSRYMSDLTERSGVFSETTGRSETESISDLFESRVEWRPASTFLYSVTGRYIESGTATWSSYYGGVRRELIQRVDLRPDSRTLYAAQLSMTRINEHQSVSYRTAYLPSFWAEYRVSKSLLLRLMMNSMWVSFASWSSNGDLMELTPAVNITMSFHDLPILRRIELRDDVSFTYSESRQWATTWIQRILQNSFYCDWYPHQVLLIRMRYTSFLTANDRPSVFDDFRPDAQLQMIMQL